MPFHVPAPDYREQLLGKRLMARRVAVRAHPRRARQGGAAWPCSWGACWGKAIPSLSHPRLLVAQIYNTGARSLIIVMLCGLFVGMVLGLQGYDLLQRFGSESALGVAAALGLVKELGPVITALLFAGRAGTSLTSEIGLMRATDQLDGHGNDGRRSGAARGRAAVSSVASLPCRLLVAIFDVVGIYRCPADRRWHAAASSPGPSGRRCRVPSRCATSTRDWSRAWCFGVACSLMAVYEGFHAKPTAEGVGLATTRTVVSSAVLTLLLDYMLTAAFLNS